MFKSFRWGAGVCAMVVYLSFLTIIFSRDSWRASPQYGQILNFANTMLPQDGQVFCFLKFFFSCRISFFTSLSSVLSFSVLSGI